MLLKSTQISIESPDDFLRYVSTWRTVCEDALHAMKQRFRYHGGNEVDHDAIAAHDLQYIITDWDLSSRLRTLDRDAYTRFQELNRRLWVQLFEASSPPASQVMVDLRAYHHFFDASFAGDDYQTLRLSILGAQHQDGDLITANLEDKADFDSQVLRFRRLFLARKLVFLDDLTSRYTASYSGIAGEAHMLKTWAKQKYDFADDTLHESSAEPPTWFRRLRSFVDQHMDYDIVSLGVFFERARAVVRPLLQAPPGSSALSRYRYHQHHVKNYEEQIDALVKATGTLRSTDNGAREELSKLMAERNLSAYAAERSAKQLGVLGKMGKNVVEFDKSTFLVNAGLLMVCSSGLGVAKALDNMRKGAGHRNDWSAIGEDVLKDLVQVGAMLVVSLLFGPGAGSMAAGTLGKLLRGTPPDPYEAKFQELNHKLDKVLNNINDLPAQLKTVIDSIPDTVVAAMDKANFQTRVLAFRNRLKAIHTLHDDVLSNRVKKLDDHMLRGMHQELRSDIQFLISMLWNSGFTLSKQKVLEPGMMELGADSVLSKIVGADHQLGSPKRFQHTIETVFSLVRLTEDALSHYHQTVPKLQALLGINATIFDGDDRKGQFASALELATLKEDDELVLFLAVNEMRLSAGRQNTGLYLRLQQYWDDPDGFDAFKGFLLRPVGSSGPYLTFEHLTKGDANIDDEDFRVVWSAKSERRELSQLFIVPDGASQTAKYQVVNPRGDDYRRPSKVQLSIGPNDTLVVTHRGAPPEYVQTQAVVSFIEDDPGESQRLEAWARDGMYRLVQEQDGNLWTLDVPLALEHGKLELRVEAGVLIVRLAFWYSRSVELLSVPVRDKAELIIAKRYYWMAGTEEYEEGEGASKQKKQRFFIGFGVRTNDREDEVPQLEPETVIRLDRASITNRVCSMGAFDFELRSDTLRAQKIESFTFDNLSPFVPKSYLLPTQKMMPGSYLMNSKNDRALWMQADGNLVLYGNIDEPRWASNTNGKTVDHLVFQTDGNLVAYRDPQGKHAEWAASWYECQLEPKKFSKFVLYQGVLFTLDSEMARTRDKHGKWVWETSNATVVWKPH